MAPLNSGLGGGGGAMNPERALRPATLVLLMFLF